MIDSEQWPRACLRAELIERGYDPYGFVTIRSALESFSQGLAAKPRLIILELRGQNLTERIIDAIRDVRVPIIVLGGSIELNECLIQQNKWEVVLKRPISLGTIADVAQKIVSKNRSAA